MESPQLKACAIALWRGHTGAGVLAKRKAVRRWNEAWVCALASSVGLVTTVRTNTLSQ